MTSPARTAEIVLATKAITSVRGVAQPPCDAILVIGGLYGPQLRTQWGAGWSLSTLLGVDDDHWSRRAPLDVSNDLAIDAGAGWVLHNARDLVVEATRIALGLVR